MEFAYVGFLLIFAVFLLKMVLLIIKEISKKRKKRKGISIFPEEKDQ